MKPVVTLSFFLFIIMISCRKEEFSSDPSLRLNTNVDSLHFDTVFTTTGSVSQFFKIMNDNDKGVEIASVRLAGGAASPFKINADGRPGPVVNQIEVAGHDSVYVYVTVKIDPNAADLPFVVRDSIEISYNGNTEWVQLEAFGQNAHFFRNHEITGNQVWTNDLPYVLLDGFTIDTNATLTIMKGCRVHINARSAFIVNGTLIVQGEKWDSTRVIFTGDRLDIPYRDFPASYPGIFISESSVNNDIRYALIKNAYQGIVVNEQASNSNPKLLIRESIIDNAYDIGLFGINTTIRAENLLIGNSGKNLVLVKGGGYEFVHCTIASVSSDFLPHKEPVVYVADYISNSPGFPLSATFQNCILWGESNGLVKNEVITSKRGNQFSVLFRDVIWRVETNPTNSSIVNAMNLSDPGFIGFPPVEGPFNFRLAPGSPALNTGSASLLLIDLDGNLRPVGLPDLGAYERQ